jgi:methionyl-tRNA formyltransferase
MSLPWRIVFMGTPAFAGPSLLALHHADDHIPELICRPDRPSGRGQKSKPPEIKVLAASLGLDVNQPASVRDPSFIDHLSGLSPDLLVVVAFGQILPRTILDIPKRGVLNIHPSLLPRYRGPAPINWAVINGDHETGVTSMFLDEGMDTGPILLSRRVTIGETETAGQLHDRLAKLGAELLMETIDGLKHNTLNPRPQPEEGVIVGRLLKKEDGRINWERTAVELSAQVRGMDPWPGAFTTFKNKTLKLFGAKVGPGRGIPGQVLTLDDQYLHVAARTGSLAVAELQLAGKKRQPARDFRHGQRLTTSDRFGE